MEQQRAGDQPRLNQWRPQTHARATPWPQEPAPAAEEPAIAEPARVPAQPRLEAVCREIASYGQREGQRTTFALGRLAQRKRVAQSSEEQNSVAGTASVA